MSLKENVIYPNGYTSKFTYNNVDYDLTENYDKDVYDLYHKHMDNYFLNFWLRLLDLKNDIKIASEIKLLSKPSYQEIKKVYDNFVSEFNMHIAHFTVYYIVKDLANTGKQILFLFKNIHNLIEEYKVFTTNVPVKEYVKILKVEETPGQFTNTIKKLKESVYKDKLEKIDIKKLVRY